MDDPTGGDRPLYEFHARIARMEPTRYAIVPTGHAIECAVWWFDDPDQARAALARANASSGETSR